MAGFELDPNALTIEETEILCEAMGIDDIRQLSEMTKGALPPRMIRALAWMAKRKQDPAFTMEQAGEMTVQEFSALLNIPNFPGGAEAAVSTTSSARSARSTTSRRTSSAR